ncbi:hypothetical protein LTR94_027378, partial [Friedmanniomyces endolithicus]
GHLRAVSRRAAVSEAVSDAIVERGDDETLGVLLGTEGASLSRAATETAVERARANPALHAVTVERASLPPDLLNDMYFAVEARLRQRILEQNARLDPALLESALAAGRTRVAAEDGALPADYAESLAYVEELRAANQLTPQVLARFLRSGGQTAFLIALSQLADVDFHTARQIIERRELDALAVICKAADLDRALFLTYAVVLLNTDDNAMGKARAYAGMYNELTREAALRTLIAAARVADGLDREARRGGFVTRMLAGLAAWMVNRLAGGDDEATAVKLGGCSGAAIDADWPQPVPQKEALWYQAAAVERQLGLDIGVRTEVQARVRDRRIVAFEVAFGFSRLQDAALGAEGGRPAVLEAARRAGLGSERGLA